ncbi:MAG: FHA domain-containing protein, partial [Myxococcales bacterium]|nr:FHA domain-containing protein [Myxococcales bacterium]
GGAPSFPRAATNAMPAQPPRAVPPTAIDPPIQPSRAPVAPVAHAPAPAPARPSAPPPRRSEPAVTPSKARGRVVVIAKSGADGPSYPLTDTLDIGRQEGHLIVAEDPYLSPRHVRLVFQGDKLVLRDLNSTNGVYLRLSPADRGERRGTALPKVGGLRDAESGVVLEDGDFVLVGQQVLRLEVLGDGAPGDPLSEHGTLVFGTPAAPRYARLSQRSVEGMTRDVYYVRKAETVLGRESGDVVFTEDPFLSRRHAALRLVGDDGAPLANGAGGRRARLALVDLGSSNGTFVRVRGDVTLRAGDQFRVGQQLFRVDLDADRVG